MKIAVLNAVVLVLAAGASAAVPKAIAKNVISWQPAKLAGGSPVLFELKAPLGTRSVSGIWFGHEANFFHRAGTNSWYLLAGIPVEITAGIYRLQVNEEVSNGKVANIRRKVKVARATYPRITVKVAKKYTEPSPEQLKAIDSDKELKTKVFEIASPQRLWAGQFQAPVAAAISDIFGTARVFNGEVQSRHQGLDFGVPSGTPIHAVNGGTVILARPLYFEGNCVVIDHGQGLLSLYLHMSQIHVKEGEEVRRGQAIGLSGETGRASGPHLHLAIRWQGVYLDPAILLKLQLPED
jgi:murein DD-endopeptidase MepM/ murein hydrolase activator NlpD